MLVISCIELVSDVRFIEEAKESIAKVQRTRALENDDGETW